jgi:hypothetical protein
MCSQRCYSTCSITTQKCKTHDVGQDMQHKECTPAASCILCRSYAQYPTTQVTQHFVHSTDLLPKRPTAWCQVLLEKRTVSSLVKQVHCHVQSSLWLAPFLSQINLVHATHPVYLIHLLILSFHRHTSPKQFLSSLIPVTTPVRHPQLQFNLTKKRVSLVAPKGGIAWMTKAFKREQKR